MTMVLEQKFPYILQVNKCIHIPLKSTEVRRDTLTMLALLARYIFQGDNIQILFSKYQ